MKSFYWLLSFCIVCIRFPSSAGAGAGAESAIPSECSITASTPLDELPTATCECLPHCDSWEKPAASRAPSCFFFDLGVEVAQSTLAFFGEGATRSCRYGPLTHKVFDRNWFHNNICGWETEQVIKLFEQYTWPKLKEHGFSNTSAMCQAILVEPSLHFTKLLNVMKSEYGKMVDIYHPAAIHQCDSSSLLFNDDKQKRSAILASSHKRAVRSINLARLITNKVRKEDFLVLKVDVEGAEYTLLDCLVESPAMDLVDQLWLERHDFWVNKDQSDRLDAILKKVEHKGIYVNQKWP